jgi:hypothetical protein
VGLACAILAISINDATSRRETTEKGGRRTHHSFASIVNFILFCRRLVVLPVWAVPSFCRRVVVAVEIGEREGGQRRVRDVLGALDEVERRKEAEENEFGWGEDAGEESVALWEEEVSGGGRGRRERNETNLTRVWWARRRSWGRALASSTVSEDKSRAASKEAGTKRKGRKADTRYRLPSPTQSKGVTLLQHTRTERNGTIQRPKENRRPKKGGGNEAK